MAAATWGRSAWTSVWLALVAGALGGEALGQTRDAGATAIRPAHQDAAEVVAGAADAAEAAVDEAPERTWLEAIWRGLSVGADFFFRRAPGQRQHDRTWGVVPLVIADSNRGFGGGLAFVEQDFLGLGLRFEVNATVSSERFVEPALSLEGPPVLAGIDWSFLAEYRNRPRLLFYGIGNTAQRSDRASLWLEETRAEIRLGRAFTDRLTAFGIFRFQNVNARDGTASDEVPVSERFDVEPLIGFGSAGLTNAVGATFLIDGRDNPFDPTRGYRLEVTALYHGPALGDSPFQYGRYVADLAAFLPLVGSNLVLALHGRLEMVDRGKGNVPFYELPALGGSRILRGYLSGRIRDRHALSFQGELRFPIWRVLSGGVFVGVGRVYDKITDPLDPPLFSHYLWSAGAGLRFVLHPDILVRLDAGFSKEEALFWLSFGHAF